MSVMHTSPESGRTPQLRVALIVIANATLVSFLLLLNVMERTPSPLRLMAAWGGFLVFAGLLAGVLIEVRRHLRGSRS